MGTLTIRNLPEEVHDGLRMRAAANRRSVEAEAREMLRAGVAPTPDPDDRALAWAELGEAARQFKHREPKGWSAVDQVVAERRLEGAWEDGRISNEERLHWLERLQNYQSWPDALEAFVASRTPDR